MSSIARFVHATLGPCRTPATYKRRADTDRACSRHPFIA
jgi:hypothetical protein